MGLALLCYYLYFANIVLINWSLAMILMSGSLVANQNQDSA